MHGRVIRFVEFEFIGVGRIPRKNRGSASAYAQGHGNDAHSHSARHHLQGFYGVRVSPPDPQGGRAAQFACDPAVAVCVEGRWGARIEDIVVVTRYGPESLNTVDHGLARAG